MTTTKPKLLTADDLLLLDSQGVKGELIRGVLYEKVSSNIEHGKVVINVASELKGFVKPRRLGTIFGSDAGVLLERGPDTVREADVAFTSGGTLAPRRNASTGYHRGGPPDLVVEIVSPSDRRRGRGRKGAAMAGPWRKAGLGGLAQHPHHRRPPGPAAPLPPSPRTIRWTAGRCCPVSPCRCGKCLSSRGIGAATHHSRCRRLPLPQ